MGAAVVKFESKEVEGKTEETKEVTNMTFLERMATELLVADAAAKDKAKEREEKKAKKKADKEAKKANKKQLDPKHKIAIGVGVCTGVVATAIGIVTGRSKKDEYEVEIEEEDQDDVDDEEEEEETEESEETEEE